MFTRVRFRLVLDRDSSSDLQGITSQWRRSRVKLGQPLPAVRGGWSMHDPFGGTAAWLGSQLSAEHHCQDQSFRHDAGFYPGSGSERTVHMSSVSGSLG